MNPFNDWMCWFQMAITQLLATSHSSQFNSSIVLFCALWLLFWRLHEPLNYFKVGHWKHMFVMHSYFYENSNSFDYRNQSVAATIFSLEHKGLDVFNMDLQCIISTGHILSPVRSTKAQIYGTFESGGSCKLNLYLAVCQFQSPYKLRQLGYRINGKTFKHTNVETVSTAKRLTLVSCPGRIYNFERWQLFVTMMELYASYGVQLTVVHLHSVHIRVYELLELYRAAGMLAYRPYMELPDGLSTIRFKPNAETPWTNQAQHFQDCLLAFRENADYVIFGDWDDIIYVPHNRPLLSVLQNFFSSNKNAGSMYIERFEGNVNTLDMMAAKNMTIFDYWSNGIDFSMKRRMGKHDDRTTDGKSIVRPDKALGVGHFAYLFTKGYKAAKIRQEKLLMVHARKHEPPMPNVVPLRHLNEPFRRRLGKHGGDHFLSLLPKQELLVSQVQKCFDNLIAVMGEGGSTCPGGLACHEYRRAEGAECMRSKSTWETATVPLVLETGLSREDRIMKIKRGGRRSHPLLISTFQSSEMSVSDYCF